MNVARHLRSKGYPLSSESVLSVILDEHTTHCLTESHLDTWWASQTPEAKAEIFEHCLEAAPEPLPAPRPEEERFFHAPFSFAPIEAAR